MRVTTRKKQWNLQKQKTGLDYLTALGSIATPILVLVLTAVGWKIRQSFERRMELEEKLREDRIEIYNIILEPFTLLTMTSAAWEHDKKNRNHNKDDIAVGKMLSLEYRKTASKLSLIANDDVVFAYNDLMQFFYSRSNKPNDAEGLKKMLELLGKFYLQVLCRVVSHDTYERCEDWHH